MLRYCLPCALALVLAAGSTAPAAESKFKVVVIQAKEGVQVSAVTPGGLGTLMGLKKDDVIVGYEFNGGQNGKTAAVRTPKDLPEFLAGKDGRYRIVVQRNGKEELIVGRVRSLPDRKDPTKTIQIFLSETTPKK